MFSTDSIKRNTIRKIRKESSSRKGAVYGGNSHRIFKKYGDIPFREKPLNDVDSLALCQLSYLKFDGMVSDVRHNGPSVTLQEIAKRPDVEQLFGDVRFEKENRALFEGLLSGRRFRNMKLNCYINLVEKEWETQFSAITFILDDGTLFWHSAARMRLLWGGRKTLIWHS